MEKSFDITAEKGGNMAVQYDVEKTMEELWNENPEMDAEKKPDPQLPKQRPTLCPDQCGGYWYTTIFEDRGMQAQGAKCLQCAKCVVGVPY